MELYNRELSWLSFNERVLQESLDPANPIIERMRFLGIYSNNMDEFFRVRVASVIRLIELKQKKVEGFNGGPEALLKEIRKRVLEQQQQFEISYQKLLVELKQNNILIAREDDLTENEKEFVTNYFRETVRPAIVPVMLSTKRHPQMRDHAIYLAVKMIAFDKSKVKYALVEIPKNSPRFIVLPTGKSVQKKLILIDDIIRLHLPEIFNIFYYDDISAYTCKITRDAELDVDDDISKSFIDKMRESVAMRKMGEAVRFVYDSAMPIDMLRYLMNSLKLEAGENIIPGGRYHNFKDFINFPDFGIEEFKFNLQKPQQHPDFISANQSLIKTVLEKDVLLSFPFQTFQHVIDILREAAIDPKVISIKINLYRVAADSQIINSLISAAQNGKKVTVIIELKARFDENNNIKWSNILEENGVIVMFGVPNMKVHSKLFLIKRKNNQKTEMIAHIGSGNFHEKTARVYTDCTLLTSDPELTKEVDKIFKILKNNLDRSIFRELLVSPFNMRRKITALIDQEIENASQGKAASIQLKLNNLIDSSVIKKLYEASQAGVKVELVIRGICGVIPGIKGKTENITVRSIVGRYLEHSRILIFGNAGEPKYFISSADWMERNIDRRIEVTAPIYDKEIQKDLQFIFDACMNDNQKARIIDAHQKNKKVKSDNEKTFNAQNELYAYFCKKAKHK